MRGDRGGEPQRAGDLIDALLGGPMGAGLSGAQRAARAWYSANGDRERAHTTSVWLRKSGRVGVDPVLVVSVDAHWLAQELSTNKELYLSRLSFSGLGVSDIQFVVSRETSPAKRPSSAREATEEPQKKELPQLSAAERERVERATQSLPDGLKKSVRRAMSASLRRAKNTNGI